MTYNLYLYLNNVLHYKQTIIMIKISIFKYLTLFLMMFALINTQDTQTTLQVVNQNNNLQHQIHDIQEINVISTQNPNQYKSVDQQQQDKSNTNQTNPNSTSAIQDATFAGLIASGATAATSAISSAVISIAGFGSGGVAAGSVAAGVQSGIGLVQAGSAFSYLQAAGALGQGIFGAYALPVIIGAGLAVGGYVLLDKYVINPQ